MLPRKMAITTTNLLSKFRGCLTGAVAGDVLGSEFEFCAAKYEEVVDHVNSPEKVVAKRGGKLQFTDDTAMARSIAESLIRNRGYDAKDLSTRFAKEFKREPHRGYGANVISVFDKLLDPELQDVYQPARDQFNGTGSYGNGGAMRVAPVALFAYLDFDEMIKLAKQTTLLTHFHRLGYNGAILQCLAVHLALHHSDGSTLNINQFIDKLIEHMERIENKQFGQSKRTKSDEPVHEDDIALSKNYCKKLTIIKDLLQMELPKHREIVDKLGNDVSAYESVPTAIYSFLHCLKPSPDTSTNGLVRTITYAISLGGDTDTIATMAGAIAGAYYGMESIPENWKTCCEGMDDAVEYANQFYHFVTEKDGADTK